METDHLLLYEDLNRLPTPLETDANLKYLEGKSTATSAAVEAAKVAAQAAQLGAEEAQADADQSRLDAATSAAQALAAKNLAVSKADEAAASLDGLQGIRPDLASTTTGKGAEMLGTKQLYPFSIPRTQHDKNGDIVDARGWGVKGDGLIYSDKLQKALDDLGGYGGTLHVWGLNLLDTPIQIPEGVILKGFGKKASILRVVGQDTHGRNSQISEMFLDQATINFPSAISLEGSDSSIQNLLVDANGMNNHVLNDSYGIDDYLIETRHFGVNAIRIGGLYYRSSAAVPARKIYRASVRDVLIRNASWGAVSIQGQIMNKITGGVGEVEGDFYGVVECGLYDSYIEKCNSNIVQVNGVANAEVLGNRIISPFHNGIKAYTRVKGALFKGNTILCDDARQLVWDPRDTTVRAYRERELATRSEMICIGHSDYDTPIEDVTVIDNKVYGNNVGVTHGVVVYGGAVNAKVSNNHIYGTIHGVSWTFPHSVQISGNKIRSAPYTTAEISPGTVYVGSDLAQYSRGGEVSKTMPSLQSRVTATGNDCQGSGGSLVRLPDFTRLTALGIAPVYKIQGNSFDLSDLGSGGVTVSPIGILNNPTAGVVEFSDNQYTKNGALAQFSEIYVYDPSVSFIRIYDEHSGTFTPTLTGSGTAGAATYTAQSGRWFLRRGRVDIQIDLGWSAHTGTGDIRIGGLPFALKTGSLPALFAVGCTGLTFTGQIYGQAGAGSSTISLFGLQTGAAVATTAIDTSVTALRLNGSYEAQV